MLPRPPKICLLNQVYLANYTEILLHEHCLGCIEIAESLGTHFSSLGASPLGMKSVPRDLHFQCIPPNVHAILYFREPPSPCKNLSLIDDGTCDLINFNENCEFDGKDCCPNPTAIGDDHCNPENNIRFCNYDGGDCCNPQKIMDGFCDANNLNRHCNYDGEDCYCDYMNWTRDGNCNLANNKYVCLFDAFDCSCPNSLKIDNGECDEENQNENCNNDGIDCGENLQPY